MAILSRSPFTYFLSIGKQGVKTQYLDSKNCDSLLPEGHGLRLVEHLDDMLAQVNESEGPLNGAVDALINQNRRTQSATYGSARSLKTLLEVSQVGDVETGEIAARVGMRQQLGPAKYHLKLLYGDRMAWKIIIPLQYLLKWWGDANRGYQGYIHVLAHNLEKIQTYEDLAARAEADSDEFYYVGITGRNWLTRLSEHVGEMRRGSRRAFYEEWRRSLNLDDVLFASNLVEINLTYKEAMQWEEVLVDRVAYGPNGLNMIPGGFKGQRLLHEANLLGRKNKSLGDREKAISEYARRHSRKGIPNPFMADLWKNDEHYLKVNESHPKRLSAEQVRHVRELAATGYSNRDITKIVGALDERQVQKVVAGKTYNRVS